MNPEERQKAHNEISNGIDFDMDNPPKVIHRWVDRGLILSCEGAGHPNHRHHKVSRRTESSQNS